MKTKDFDYHLPEQLIATAPLPNRDKSRLLIVDKIKETLQHHRFHQLIQHLSEGDILVLNDTRVIKARFFANKDNGVRVEFLLTRKKAPQVYIALAKPGKRLKRGDVLTISSNFQVKIMEKENAFVTVKFLADQPAETLLEKVGLMPIPPYIQTGAETSQSFEQDYQTVFAQEPGAIAAPTAGLHFTPELLASIQKKGVKIETITLHVGYGTFKPLTVDRVEEHRMHTEQFHISNETAKNLNQAIGKQRIIAVGTTSLRALESAGKTGLIQPGKQDTNLFIYPGFNFQIVDGLITNFHLPKSSLLLLVSAFAGTHLIKQAYQAAIEQAYRFYSFGDAMFITGNSA